MVPEAPAQGTPAPTRRRAWRAALFAVLGLLLLALAAAAGGLWWGLRSEQGTAWLLSRLPGLEVVKPRGTLIGDFGAEALVWRFGDGGELRLHGVGWEGLGLYRSEAESAWALVWFDALHAQLARLTLPRPAQTERTPPPKQLQLPVELVVRQLRIDELHAAPAGTQALRHLRAQVHLGAERGRVHRIDHLSVERGPLRVHANARVSAMAPMLSEIALSLRQDAAAQWPAWQAEFQLAGPLALANLSGRVAAQTTPPQGLELDAILQPFAAWPLARLNARAQALDVSALLAAGPRTALNGELVIRAADAEKPLNMRADLANTLAGPWQAGHLPVRRIQLEVATDPHDHRQARLHFLQLELGSAQREAGRVQGTGQWTTDQGASVQLMLQGVQAALLDGRAMPMTVDGQLRAAIRADAAAGPAAPGQPARRRADLSADLTGRTPGSAASAPPVRVLADARLLTGEQGRLQASIQRLAATQGRSTASLRGELQRASEQAPWQAQGRLDFSDFDPRPWWPAGIPGRHAASRLSGAGDFQLTVAAPAATPAAPSWTSRLQGQANLRLAQSLLAGVPIQADARWRGLPGAAMEATLAAEAAGNRVNGRATLGGAAGRDHVELQLAAPALQRLDPLWRLLAPGRGAPAPRVGGALRANLVADGRWPDLRTHGDLHAEQLVWPGWRLRQGTARWRFDPANNGPMDASAELQQLTLAQSRQARQIPSLALKLTGTAAAHRLELQTEVAAAPPAWADAAPAPPAARSTGPRTRLRAQAAGAIVPAAAGQPASVAGWRGRIESLEAVRADNAQPLLRSAGIQLEWLRGLAPRPARLQVQPGRAELLGSALRWNRLAWQAGTSTVPAQFDIDAALEPMRVAPLLARLQPEFGWSGDLEISGRAAVRTAPALRVDVSLKRHGGDLQMVQAGARRTLGLDDLELALRSERHTWQGSARVVSRTLGTFAAQVTARTDPARPWPGAGTPMQGSAELRVKDLGIYDPWLPIGWRLGGQLTASARLGGRLGAPEYVGTLRGQQLSVRNFVEGVHVKDGELAATLDGERGRIERLVARAGEGQLRVEGGATFGAAPTAQLTLTAQRFRALGRVDRLVDVSGRAQMRLDAQRIALQGGFKVDQGLVDLGRGEAPELSKDVRVVDGPTPGRPEQAAQRTPRRPVQMDLQMDLGSNLRVRGKGVNTLLAGNLKITAPAGAMEIDGTVRTVQGTYEAYGEKLRIERGLVTFVGPVNNPRLDVQAVRADLRDVEVGVAITGTAQNPRVRLVSTPEMSELDKLSWLTLGRSSTGLASDQSAILQRAAMALLAGQRGSSGGEGIAKRLGLDTLSVGRGESGGLSDAVVSLGKQVSERFYVGYAQSLDATGGSWELIYKIARRFTLRVQTGDATAFDLIWTWLWG